MEDIPLRKMWSLFGKLRISRDDLPMRNFFSGWDGFVPNKAMLEDLYLRKQEWGIPKLFARLPNPYFEQQEVSIDLSWARTKESFTLLRAILEVLPELLPDIAARLEGELRCNGFLDQNSVSCWCLNRLRIGPG